MALGTIHLLVFLNLIATVTSVYNGWDPPACTGSDCVIYGAQFAECYHMYSGPTWDCRWAADMNRRTDEKILDGTIIVYAIRWFSGSWSPWFVPGHNDLDGKFNQGTNWWCGFDPLSLRRRWAMFYDHTHFMIICRN